MTHFFSFVAGGLLVALIFYGWDAADDWSKHIDD